MCKAKCQFYILITNYLSPPVYIVDLPDIPNRLIHDIPVSHFPLIPANNFLNMLLQALFKHFFGNNYIVIHKNPIRIPPAPDEYMTSNLNSIVICKCNQPVCIIPLINILRGMNRVEKKRYSNQ